MRSFPSLFLLAVSASSVGAQSTLAELERGFARDRDELYSEGRVPTAEQESALLRRHTKELESFVDARAKGDDRWQGRLMLADLLLMQRLRERAVETLQAIDPAEAPGLLLLLAADMAARVGQRELRDRFVAGALDKEVPFEQRMEMAKVLMTLLREVERGEAIFRQALEAATDDEARARVRWFRCSAIREREDLPENSYYVELEALARDLPDTYYGSIAKDRGTASQFTIGAPAIPFEARTTAGDEVSLADLRGKPVVLAFWSVADPGAKDLVEALRKLLDAGSDVHVLGISMDTDRREFERASKAMGAVFPQICDGRGYDAELALRYHVETTPTLIVLDRQGRIAGMNLHIDTKDARDALEQALERARRPVK